MFSSAVGESRQRHGLRLLALGLQTATASYCVVLAKKLKALKCPPYGARLGKVDIVVGIVDILDIVVDLVYCCLPNTLNRRQHRTVVRQNSTFVQWDRRH